MNMCLRMSCQPSRLFFWYWMLFHSLATDGKSIHNSRFNSYASLLPQLGLIFCFLGSHSCFYFFSSSLSYIWSIQIATVFCLFHHPEEQFLLIFVYPALNSIAKYNFKHKVENQQMQNWIQVVEGKNVHWHCSETSNSILSPWGISPGKSDCQLQSKQLERQADSMNSSATWDAEIISAPPSATLILVENLQRNLSVLEASFRTFYLLVFILMKIS